MNKITFLSSDNSSNPSIVHRCCMISDQLDKQGYSAKVYNFPPIYKFPNITAQLKTWNYVIKNRPGIIIIQRTSNFIDDYMLYKAKNSSKVIYDYDDAIFHIPYPGKFSYSHINRIMNKVDAITAGSHYLLDYAKNYNENSRLLPTPVDTKLFNSKILKNNSNKITIGWLGGGTKYHLQHLKILKKPLELLANKYDIKLRIISAFSKEIIDEFNNLNFEVDFGFDHMLPLKDIPEIISDFDIGVMPLTDTLFSRGKCSMKALEYMAMGIPVVASPVGENNYAIKNGFNGFLAFNTTEWVNYMELLILDENLRNKIGGNGCKFVAENYSLKVIVKNLLNIFVTLDES